MMFNPQTLAPLTAADRPLGVLVGFDGSEQGFLALHYAARAAQRRDTRLTVINAFKIPANFYNTLAALPSEDELSWPRRNSEAVLDQAREYLHGYPGQVMYRSAEGDAAGELVELSAQAELLVVGGRGRGGFLGRILGSVASAVPAHAGCPTVIVPRAYDPEATRGPSGERFAPVEDSQPVVVGLDGSAASRLAALQAAQAAVDRGVSLRLIIAMMPVDAVADWYPDIDYNSMRAEQRRKALEDHVDAEIRWLRTHIPELAAEATIEVGDAAELLIRASEAAQLTVVGTRGRGGVRSTLMGSTSRSVLTGATGPVMVVPELPDERLKDQPAFPS